MSTLFFKNFSGCQPHVLKEYIDELLADKEVGKFMATEMAKLPIPEGYTITIHNGYIKTEDMKTNRNVSTYIDGMPHQCGYCVLGNLDCFGVSHFPREVHMNYVEQFVRDILGYTGIVLTLVDIDKITYFQTRVYEVKWEFVNKRTGHEVATLFKELDAT